MADVKVVRRWGRSARLPGTLSPGPRLSDAVPPSVVAIAASTGGPAALQRILGDLPADFAPPLLIVQHIATGFTQGLADWLAAGSPLKIEVARHKDPLAARTALLAPDERHLAVEGRGAVAVLDSPPVGGFRPSASVLFESVARTFGSSAVGVVLTGMGADGVQGLEALRASGGHVIAQDEGSSVVYGMPRAAVEAGVVDLVLPLDEIGGYLTSLVAPASATPSSPARPKRGTP